MWGYERLFNKVIDGVASCNKSDEYSYCEYCSYEAECRKNGELYPGIATSKTLMRDIERLRRILRKLDEMGGMK